MPSGLPMNRPSAMPSGTGSSSLASDSPCSDTPALAKANSGSTPKATQGCRLSSSCSSSDGSPAPWLVSGMAMRDDHAGQRRVHARLQHAHPDEDASQQIGRQPRHAARVQERQSTASPAQASGQRQPVTGRRCRTAAMMRMAPRSSRMASASRKILSDEGTRGPSSASTPTAKAISVADGMAQPLSATGSPALIAT